MPPDMGERAVVHASDLPRAVAACDAVAAARGLRDQAFVVNDTNRLEVHLRPCEVLSRLILRGSTALAAAGRLRVSSNA